MPPFRIYPNFTGMSAPLMPPMEAPIIPAQELAGQDMPTLMAIMGGGFDPMGRYGITDEQRRAANLRGIGTLGQSLAMGAMSADWGKFGAALASGVGGAGIARDQMLDQFSGANMNNQKFTDDREKHALSVEAAKLNLEKAKEDIAQAKKEREASLKVFDEQMADYNAALDSVPAGPEKDLILSGLKRARIYVSAGAVERAGAVIADLQDEFPQYRERLQAIENSKREADALAAVERLKLVRAQAEGTPGEFTAAGNWVPLTPEQVADKEAQRSIQRRQVAVAEKRLELDAAKPPSGSDKFTPRVPEPREVRKLADGISGAIEKYNEAVRRLQSVPKLKPGEMPSPAQIAGISGLAEAVDALPALAADLKSAGVFVPKNFEPIKPVSGDRLLDMAQTYATKRYTEDAEIAANMEVAVLAQELGVSGDDVKRAFEMDPGWVVNARNTLDRARTGGAAKLKAMADLKEQLAEMMDASEREVDYN